MIVYEQPSYRDKILDITWGISNSSQELIGDLHTGCDLNCKRNNGYYTTSSTYAIHGFRRLEAMRMFEMFKGKNKISCQLALGGVWGFTKILYALRSERAEQATVSTWYDNDAVQSLQIRSWWKEIMIMLDSLRPNLDFRLRRKS